MFGGRDLLQRRVDTDPEATERFKRETTAERPARDRRRRRRRWPPRRPALNRDRILTLVGIAALVVIAAVTLDWDVGFVAVTIAVVLSLLMPHATKDAARRSRGRPCC